MTGSRKYLRLLIGVAVLVALVFAFRSLELPSCASINTWIAGLGLIAPIAFFLIYVTATIAFIPGLIVTVLAGVAFGPWWGTALVSISSVTGATLAFLISRYVARESVEGFLSKQAWFGKFRSGLEDSGFNFVLFVRLVPLFPFNGLNYACGLVPLKLRDYVLGSFLGMLPGTFAYVYAGNAVGCALIDSKAGLPPEVQFRLFVAIGLLATLSVVPVAIKKFKKKKVAS